jgi:hypothetical protein
VRIGSNTAGAIQINGDASTGQIGNGTVGATLIIEEINAP